MKTLVVYFSRKGYAKRIAEREAEKRYADLLSLSTPERTYGILGFWWCGRFGMHRWGMELSEYDCDVSAYEKVVLVSPIWVFTFCAPIRRFAELEAGRIKSAEYVFLHFSPPMKYDKSAASLDSLLKLRRDGYQSLCCMWGHIFSEKEFR